MMGGYDVEMTYQIVQAFQKGNGSPLPSASLDNRAGLNRGPGNTSGAFLVDDVY